VFGLFVNCLGVAVVIACSAETDDTENIRPDPLLGVLFVLGSSLIQVRLRPSTLCRPIPARGSLPGHCLPALTAYLKWHCSLLLCDGWRQAVQFVAEEKVMTTGGIPPMVVMGVEGVWGVLLTGGAVMPAAFFVSGPDNGSVENGMDTLALLLNSAALRGFCCLFLVVVCVFNVIQVAACEQHQRLVYLL
jgi:hypothetical protein